MIEDLEKRLETIYASLDNQKFEFEEAARCCVEAIHGMNERLERLEKWMANQEKLAV